VSGERSPPAPTDIDADDRWVGVEEAIGLAREVGLGEGKLLEALQAGEVRSRGWSVIPLRHGKAADVGKPVHLRSEFWSNQNGVLEVWVEPDLKELPVGVDIHQPSLEGWIDRYLRAFARQHAARPEGKPGRPSPKAFLRAMHKARAALRADIPNRTQEAQALIELLARADPDKRLGPKPSSVKHVVTHVFD
jgi:hypothetical protein